jgi:hypothetical protein
VSGVPDAAGAGVVRIDKEMTISHRDFFRVLPGALETDDFCIEGDTVTSGDGGRRLTIVLAPEAERRIALLKLPVTRVSLEFAGYEAAAVADAVARFDRAFQRGGG